MKSASILILAAILSVHPSGAQKVFTREQLDRVMHPALLPGASTYIRIDTAEISSGIISEDDSTRAFTFRCTNTSDRRIAITRISTTCGCTEARTDRDVLQPGDEARITLLFSPFGHPGKSFLRAFVYTDISESEPIAVLTVNTEVTPSSRLWKDYRYTIGPLKLRSMSADLGRIRVGKPKILKIACANSGSRPLRITPAAGFLPDHIRLYTIPSTLAPSEEGALVIEYSGATPAGAPGKHNHKVLLDGLDLRPSGRMITVSLELTK